MDKNIIHPGKENSILQIHHPDSIINSYYDMSAPIQFTFSYCSGLCAEDYYNVVSVSPGEDYFYTSRIVSSFHKFNARPLHRHSFFELIIVLKGSIMQKLEDRQYLYPEGTCCLINQNVFHIERYIGKAQVLFIGLSVNFIKELLESHRTAYFQKEETAYDNSIFQFMDANIQERDGKNYLDFLPAFQNRKNIEKLQKLSDVLIHSMMFPKFGSTYIIKGVICELVLVYKYGQKKLNNLYYQVKEQRRCSKWQKTKNLTLWNINSRSWICTMPEEPRIHNWSVNMA